MNPRQQADSCPTSHLAQRAGAHGPGSARHLGHYQGEAPLPRRGRGLAAHSQEAARPLAQGVVVEGTAVSAVTLVTLEAEADLVVVGSKGVDSLLGRIFGAVSVQVLRKSQCDVLVVVP